MIFFVPMKDNGWEKLSMVGMVSRLMLFLFCVVALVCGVLEVVGGE